MFEGCSSLESVNLENLKPTKVTNMYGMFNGCSSLVTAPKLPAATLADYCYSSIFYDCSSLNSVTCLATDLGQYTINLWLSNTSSTGTLYCPASMIDTWNSRKGQNSGIPEGWTVQEYVPAN